MHHDIHCWMLALQKISFMMINYLIWWYFGFVFQMDIRWLSTTWTNASTRCGLLPAPELESPCLSMDLIRSRYSTLQMHGVAWFGLGPSAPPVPQTGTGQTECQDPPPTYPVTLLQFTIDHSLVSYEVSLNQGYNDAPVRIQPDGGTLVGGSRACPVVDCIQDLSNVCPSTLVAKNKAGWAVGCFSPCDAFKDPKYGCTGSYTGPQCLPNEYSETFKQLCNLAHAYPGDKEPPFYECNGAKAYNITFCPF